MKYTRVLAAVAAAGGLAACTSGNGAVAPPVSSVNVGSSSYSHLQFAAGVANLAGQTMLNTVVTLRQPNGNSAVDYSTPAITWTGAFVNPGISPAGNVDAGKPQITGSPLAALAGQSVPPSTFGSGSNSYGAFGYGFDNANVTTNGGGGSIRYPCLPIKEAPVTAPVLSTNINWVNPATGAPICGSGQINYVGGPPAFPQYRNAQLSGELGSFLGFTMFSGIVPAPSGSGTSTFTLNVSIPTAGGATTLTPVSATMSSFAGLPTFAPPVSTEDGTGGLSSITYALPAGATEGYIEVMDVGPDPTNGSPNCNYGGAPPFFYTIKVTSSGTTSLGDNLAPVPAIGAMPAGKSSHTLCTAADNAAAAAQGVPITNGGAPVTGVGNSAGDVYYVLGIAFDYPAYEAAYPQSNGNPAPAITGANGQADVSISDAAGGTNY